MGGQTSCACSTYLFSSYNSILARLCRPQRAWSAGPQSPATLARQASQLRPRQGSRRPNDLKCLQIITPIWNSTRNPPPGWSTPNGGWLEQGGCGKLPAKGCGPPTTPRPANRCCSASSHSHSPMVICSHFFPIHSFTMLSTYQLLT